MSRPEAPSGIAIRPMAIDDAPAVAEMAKQLGYPSTEDQIRIRFRALEGTGEARVWVAENADRHVIGWIHAYVSRSMESDPFVEIGGLVVHGAARGNGIGRALVEVAEGWAREAGHRVIRVRSNVIRTEAHEFYKGLGYAVLKTQVRFRKEF